MSEVMRTRVGRSVFEDLGEFESGDDDCGDSEGHDDDFEFYQEQSYPTLDTAQNYERRREQIERESERKRSLLFHYAFELL